MSNNQAKILLREKELIIARLEVLSPELHFSVGGSFQNVSRDEMISYVKNDDPIGKDFIKTELEFLRALKNGTLVERLVAE